MKRRTPLQFAVLAALALTGLPAATHSYTETLVSGTSISIAGSTHGLACSTFGVRVYDSNDNRRSDLISNLSINSSSFNVSFTLGSALNGGRVTLQGCFPSYTTASTDFFVQITGISNESVFVCGACTDDSPAARASGGVNYVSVTHTSVDVTGTQTGTLYVWVDPSTGLVGFGTTTSVGVTNNSAGSSLVHNVAGYPAGVLHLGRVTYQPVCVGMACGSSVFWSATDDRPW